MTDFLAGGVEHTDPAVNRALIAWMKVQQRSEPTALDFVAMAAALKAAQEVGEWIRAEDVNRLVRELDIAWNGAKAAPQAALCDIVGQIIKDMLQVDNTAFSDYDIERSMTIAYRRWKQDEGGTSLLEHYLHAAVDLGILKSGDSVMEATHLFMRALHDCLREEWCYDADLTKCPEDKAVNEVLTRIRARFNVEPDPYQKKCHCGAVRLYQLKDDYSVHSQYRCEVKT